MRAGDGTAALHVQLRRVAVLAAEGLEELRGLRRRAREVEGVVRRAVGNADAAADVDELEADAGSSA